MPNIPASSEPPRHPKRKRGGNPHLTRLIGPVYAPSALYEIGNGAIQPVLVLAALAIGMSQSAASTVVGLIGVTAMISSPIAGSVVERLGGRRSMISSVSCTIFSLLLTLLVLGAAIPHAALWFTGAVVVRAVAGNVWGLSRQGSVADVVPIHMRARAMSLLGGMMRLGALIGPAIGSVIVALWGISAPFVLAVCLSLLALSFVLTQPMPESELLSSQAKETPTAKAQPVQDRQVDLHTAVITSVSVNTLTLLRTNRLVLVPLWGAHLGMSEALISATFAAGALIDVAMFLPAGRWMDRHGRFMGLLPTMAIISLGLTMIVLWTSPIGFVVGTCLMGFGNGFGPGVIMTTGVDLAPTTNRNTFLGWWNGIAAIGRTVGPFAVAGLTAALGLDAGIWFTVIVGFAGFIWTALLLRGAYARVGLDLRGCELS